MAGRRRSRTRPSSDRALYPQVREFTIKKIQYKMIKPGWSPPPNAPQLYPAMEQAALAMCGLFVEWLDARLARP